MGKNSYLTNMFYKYRQINWFCGNFNRSYRLYNELVELKEDSEKDLFIIVEKMELR